MREVRDEGSLLILGTVKKPKAQAPTSPSRNNDNVISVSYIYTSGEEGWHNRVLI
jgi:hypothetical protein